MKITDKKQQGQTMIEATVALGTSLVLIGAMTVIVTTALSNVIFSKEKSIATRYAQEGIEIVRQMRNSNYPGFSALNGNYCMAKNCTAISFTAGGCGPRVDDQCDVNLDSYIREVVVDEDVECNRIGPGGAKRVSVRVSWTDSKCTGATYCHNSEISSCFSDSHVVPTP